MRLIFSGSDRGSFFVITTCWTRHSTSTAEYYMGSPNKKGSTLHAELLTYTSWRKTYPNLLVTTVLQFTVQYWEPAKWVSSFAP